MHTIHAETQFYLAAVIHKFSYGGINKVSLFFLELLQSKDVFRNEGIGIIPKINLSRFE